MDIDAVASSQDVLDTLKLQRRTLIPHRKRAPPPLSDKDSESESQEDSQDDSLEDSQLLDTSSSPIANNLSGSLIEETTTSRESTTEGSTACTGNGRASTPKRSPEARRMFRHKKIIISQRNGKKRITEGEATAILSELKKANTSIKALTDKVKKSEKRMQRVEKRIKVSSNAPPPSSCSFSKKHKIPVGIRVRMIC